jgi:DNA-binding beta-propeller fold protein YncE
VGRRWLILKANVIEVFEKAKNLQGLTLIKGQFWAVSSKSKVITGYTRDESGKFSVINKIKTDLRNPVGLAWTGSEFLVPDGMEKVIVKIDPQSKLQQLYINLLEVKDGYVKSILNAEGSSVSAITFNQGLVWIAIKAGYSSSIVALNYGTKEVVSNIFARGTEPLAIAFDANGEFGWVLDGANKELSQLDTKGTWTGTTLRIPLEKPIGLAIDNQGNFLVGEAKTKKIYTIGGV